MAKSFRVLFALQQAYSAVFGMADRDLKKSEGIITAHQVILFVLSSEDGLASSDVATRAGMSKSRLTSLVDALEKKSLIRRQRGETDARQQFLFIEPEGRALIERTKDHVSKLNAQLLRGFSVEERKIIQRFLRQAANLTDADD